MRPRDTADKSLTLDEYRFHQSGEGEQECGLACFRLAHRIDRAVADFLVLRPERNEPPPHHPGLAIPLFLLSHDRLEGARRCVVARKYFKRHFRAHRVRDPLLVTPPHISSAHTNPRENLV